MEVAYKFTPKEIQKLSKFKNPTINLDRNKIIKNGKYKIYLTKNIFNKLIEKGELKYKFTDHRKQYYIQNGGNLGNIFKVILPHAIKFGKKLLPALGITGITTTTSHLINKSLNKKKKGGNIKINLSQSNIKKINNVLEKLSNMKLTNYKSINEQNGGSILSFILPLVGSLLPSLISGKGCSCKDNFFLKK